MIGFTDIHNHILFKCDDGAESLEKSMKMIAEEYKQGARSLILTPHYDEESFNLSVDRWNSHFEQLKEATKDDFPDMKLYLGNEVLLCNDMIEKLDAGKILTMAGTRYVLIEFYPTEEYSVIERALSQLLNGGYIPIIAHCERYKAFRKRIGVINKTNLEHVVDMGCYLQVNASSVYREDKKFVTKLIENEMLHLIGTDAHSIGMRGIHWDECIEYLASKYDERYIEWLIVRNPEMIISGEYI
ncbi:MAG: hypothetical protein K6E58_02395 [Eubacterium sp.]|nr:hypothetical protein [Eubacterium sp.]